MSMSYEPIPTPCCNVAYDKDGSNNCTIVASNAGHSVCTSNLTSDKETATTQCSTDIEIENEAGAAEAEIPAGIFLPQHVLPWGGLSTNKIAAKWKQRVKERAKRRELKEASNPKYKSRGDIWKKMAASCNNQPTRQ